MPAQWPLLCARALEDGQPLYWLAALFPPYLAAAPPRCTPVLACPLHDWLPVQYTGATTYSTMSHALCTAMALVTCPQRAWMMLLCYASGHTANAAPVSGCAASCAACAVQQRAASMALARSFSTILAHASGRCMVTCNSRCSVGHWPACGTCTCECGEHTAPHRTMPHSNYGMMTCAVHEACALRPAAVASGVVSALLLIDCCCC